jgi:hypothetical protein
MFKSEGETAIFLVIRISGFGFRILIRTNEPTTGAKKEPFRRGREGFFSVSRPKLEPGPKLLW